MPTTHDKIIAQLNVPIRRLVDVWTGVEISGGHLCGGQEYLFKTIDECRIDELRYKYGGQAQKNQPEPVVKPKRNACKKQDQPVKTKDGPVLSEAEMSAIDGLIEKQALKVREMKLNKADAGLVKVEVQALLALKAQKNK